MPLTYQTVQPDRRGRPVNVSRSSRGRGASGAARLAVSALNFINNLVLAARIQAEIERLQPEIERRFAEYDGADHFVHPIGVLMVICIREPFPDAAGNSVPSLKYVRVAGAGRHPRYALHGGERVVTAPNRTNVRDKKIYLWVTR